MPEQLKPCPACNNAETIIHMASIAGQTMWFVECADDNCVHHGKACFTESAAIAAWNQLPRALTWGEEPPKVAGWYWMRCADYKDDPTIRYVTQRDADEGFAVLSIREWAGPIDAPLELEES